MATPKQKRDAEASKKTIVTHAKALFAEEGYAGASMDELARRCGLNKAMVFYYFKNKKGLYEAVLQDILDEIWQAVVEANAKHDKPEAQLESFVHTYADFACKHPYLPALLLKELSESGAVLSEMLFFSMRRLFALFSDILKRGEEKGCFGKAIPMVLYFMVLGTLNLTVTTKPLRIKAAQMEDIDVDTCASCDIDEIADYLYKGIVTMLKESA